ncbi:hypothetical protein KSD_89210 [Ktedonobacter sp. SOSP1-85]|uniref:hypothetical protein n=1 Tax=Ktedonobacter sp. SOSP1-85 TaxID=2778367 RepID=UPI001915D54F|nr:hypothetical protein [Ktedonobacter sp. SOSP1-85]GHO81150.1 hypothetical protein KSD_89210 [Ktedonobacter sp. SOSP1-85]
MPKTILKYWLLTAIIISGLFVIMYGLVQQVERLGADDPQIQMAEDVAARLASGASPQQVVPTEKVDIATSLAPYLIVFDRDGKPLASSAELNGGTPTIPSGIFESVKQQGEDRISWQPQPSVRSAIVVTQIKGGAGFVLAGRSLREVEKRENGLEEIALLGWGGLLLVTLLAMFLLFWQRPLKGASPVATPLAQD